MKTILTTPLLTLICASFLIWSCSGTGSGNTMIFKDNVRIIDEFPFEYALTAPDTVSTGVIELSGFDIQDSLLIVSTRTNTDSWKILRISDMTLLGEFLNTGNGPDEFVSFVPSVSYADRIVENGCLNYLLTDINRRILHKFNVTSSLYSQQADISSMQNDIPPACFEYIFIDDSTCFYKQPAPDNTGFIRMLARNGESFEPEGLKEINSAHVNPGQWYGPVYTNLWYSRNRNIIVEISSALNNINLYTPDATWRKSLCIGRPDNLDDIVNGPREREPITFCQARLYDDFFAVMYLGETALSYETGRTELPHIYCFGYDGSPLADIRIDKLAEDFGFAGRRLYVLDPNTESFWRYDLPEDFPESLIID